MDLTSVSTPNPCLLSPEEQNQIRALLMKTNQRTGANVRPENYFIRTILSTNNNNKGTRLSITQAGFSIYDSNGILVLSMPLGNNAAYLLLDNLFGLTGTLNLYSADATGHLQVITNELTFTATLGGVLLDILSTGALIKPVVNLTNLINKYKNIQTAGWGVPAIYASSRSLAQTGAIGSVAAYTVGTADGSFIVSANVNVTTSTTHSFTCTVAYTDEANVARTLTLNFSQLNGTLGTAITNVTGAGPYSGIPVQIRCKASTTITIATTGTFTTVTYNAEGFISQIA